MEENAEDLTYELTDTDLDLDDDPELLALRKSSGGPATGNGPD